MLLTVIFLQCVCLSNPFLFPTPSFSRFRRNGATKSLTSSASNTVASPAESGTKTTAKELLDLLVAREVRARSKEEGTYSQDTSSADTTETIEGLIQTLMTTEEPCVFDPKECISGPFYATVFTTGASPPLWQQIASLSPQNWKGQTYTLTGSNAGKVVNYAELFGTYCCLQAMGTFSKAVKQASTETKNHSSKTKKKKNRLRRLVPNPFRRKKEDTSESLGLETCPVDYNVQVTKGVFTFFENKINVPIEGLGLLRVLYADPQLRIFISPVDTSDVKWEKTGLVVVQVRGDLIDKSIEIL